MRVITDDNQGHWTNQIRFARLPGVGTKDVVVVIFRDHKGVAHAIKTSEILEIVDG